jgi:hypothetical protein
VRAAAFGPELRECVDVRVDVQSPEEGGIPVLRIVVVRQRTAPIEGRRGERTADGRIELGDALVDVELGLQLAADVGGAVLIDAVGPLRGPDSGTWSSP